MLAEDAAADGRAVLARLTPGPGRACGRAGTGGRESSAPADGEGAAGSGQPPAPASRGCFPLPSLGRRCRFPAARWSPGHGPLEHPRNALESEDRAELCVCPSVCAPASLRSIEGRVPRAAIPGAPAVLHEGEVPRGEGQRRPHLHPGQQETRFPDSHSGSPGTGAGKAPGEAPETVPVRRLVTEGARLGAGAGLGLSFGGCSSGFVPAGSGGCPAAPLTRGRAVPRSGLKGGAVGLWPGIEAKAGARLQAVAAPAAFPLPLTPLAAGTEALASASELRFVLPLPGSSLPLGWCGALAAEVPEWGGGQWGGRRTGAVEEPDGSSGGSCTEGLRAGTRERLCFRELVSPDGFKGHLNPHQPPLLHLGTRPRPWHTGRVTAA